MHMISHILNLQICFHSFEKWISVDLNRELNYYKTVLMYVPEIFYVKYNLNTDLVNDKFQRIFCTY
jgi:hypothetical protein